MTAPGERTVAVPDGLDGQRLDAALARMFGLSRSRAAELIGDGMVLLDGRPAAKSDRVLAGEPLQLTLPPPRQPEPPQPVEGLVVLYEDDDIVVVDKPRGVAAHPTPGWTGPTVVGGLLAAGHTVATGGAAERQGIVHRLDANTTGVMVVAKSERAYRALKRAFRERRVDKRYHALVQGHPDPLHGTVDAPIGRHPSGDGRFAVVSDGRPSVTHYDTLEAFRAASLVRSSRRPAGPTRSGCTWPPSGTRASATCSTARTRCWPPGWACPASGCTRSASRSTTPPTAAGSRSPARTLLTSPAPWTSSAPKVN